MEKQELNKKLAEWAGVEARLKITPRWGHYSDVTEETPEFTQSLDACFKWLVPKLRHYDLDNWAVAPDHLAWVGLERGAYKIARAETPALALCLAIEKLIDGGKNGQ